MKIKCFPDTDTLYLEFRADRIAEARDLDEDTLGNSDFARHSGEGRNPS